MLKHNWRADSPLFVAWSFAVILEVGGGTAERASDRKQTEAASHYYSQSEKRTNERTTPQNAIQFAMPICKRDMRPRPSEAAAAAVE